MTPGSGYMQRHHIVYMLWHHGRHKVTTSCDLIIRLCHRINKFGDTSIELHTNYIGWLENNNRKIPAELGIIRSIVLPILSLCTFIVINCIIAHFSSERFTSGHYLCVFFFNFLIHMSYDHPSVYNYISLCTFHFMPSKWVHVIHSAIFEPYVWHWHSCMTEILTRLNLSSSQKHWTIFRLLLIVILANPILWWVNESAKWKSK